MKNQIKSLLKSVKNSEHINRINATLQYSGAIFIDKSGKSFVLKLDALCAEKIAEAKDGLHSNYNFIFSTGFCIIPIANVLNKIKRKEWILK